MYDQHEQAELEQLEAIEGELEDIKGRMTTPKRALINGILQGMGAVLGSFAAVALLGWLLSLLGIIPGFGELGAYLERLMSAAD